MTMLGKEVQIAGGERFLQVGLIPVSQTLTCRMALASAAGTEDFSSEPGDFGRRFIQSD
jgi:hypothetical protein